MRTKAKNNALRNIITWKSKCSTPRLIKYKNKSPWPRRFFKTSTPKRTKANTSKVKNVAGTPKVLMHPVLSRGSIEQPVSIDDTLANDVVDLSVIEIPEGGQKRKFEEVAELQTRAKRLRLRDESSLEEGELRNVSIVGRGNSVRRRTPRRSQRFRGGREEGTGTTEREGEARTTEREARWVTEWTQREVVCSTETNQTHVYSQKPPPPPQELAARFGFTSNPRLETNFTRGLAHVPGKVHEFKGGSNRLVLPRMGVRQLSRPKMDASADYSNGHRFNNVYTSSTRGKKRPGSLRPIIIDGSNVAFAHGRACGLGRVFSSRGIEHVVQYFVSRGHKDVIAIVPQSRTRQGQARDSHIMHRLERDGRLVFTPSRTLPGGSYVTAYDDRYIVQLCVLYDGIMVSNDNFRDISDEGPDMREAVSQKLLQFTFLPGGNTVMFQQDPLGRSGPDLESFLKF